MFGEEGREVVDPLVGIPSDDISISSDTHDRYYHNFGKDSMKEFMNRSPLLSSQIHTGYNLADYTLSSSGPMVFAQSRNEELWAQVRDLMHSFITREKFSYPCVLSRNRDRSLVTLRDVHQRLVDQHAVTENISDSLQSIKKASHE
ncbi:hypothetical protein NX059_006208 [Plenodomus lindquistii]|nr:hypothetical protein NX059_006208 [Plenodomus lindquistii]